MATFVPAKKGVQYITYIDLIDQADTKLFKINPTIAAGDFKVSIDGGAYANLSTLPVVTPAGGATVKITLSTSEMNGDNIHVLCIDAAGAEWCNLGINIQTAARQIDDLAYPATSGRSMVVDAAGLVDANAVKVGPTGAGTAQTARDVGLSVLLSSGSGTGQLDFTSGVVKANLAQILGTALTETAGLLAGGFKKFFNIATPQATMDHGILVDTATNLTNSGTGVTGTATAGGASTITLTGTSTVDQFYRSMIVTITSGTGAGQARVITAYVGSTKVATVDRAWATNPDSSSVYSISGVAPKLNASSEVVASAVTGAVDSVSNPVVASSVTDRTGFSLSTAGILAIWHQLTAAVVTANTMGKLIKDFLDVAVSSRLSTVGYTAPANSNITAIKAKTDLIPASPAAVSDIPTANAIADAYLDRANGVETGITPRQAARVGLAADAGKLSGAATTSVKIRNQADTKDRITATVDASGNRTAVTLDLT